MREIHLEIVGLGIILYSPPAVLHIPEGSDYLSQHFWEPEDVARQVMDCQLTAFCTGAPGSYRVRLLNGPLDEARVQAADYRLRLGLQVQEGTVCVRDLYDLMRWVLGCPEEQQVTIANGWYRLTVFSSLAPGGTLGDEQVVNIHFEPWPEKPPLLWTGVPSLC